MKENTSTPNRVKRITTLFVALGTITIIAILFLAFSRPCSDIIGDGYIMGTDPAPVTIGKSCSPSLVDGFRESQEGQHNMYILIVTFLASTVILLLANLSVLSLCSIKVTRRWCVATTCVSLLFALIIIALLMYSLYITLQN